MLDEFGLRVVGLPLLPLRAKVLVLQHGSAFVLMLWWCSRSMIMISSTIITMLLFIDSMLKHLFHHSAITKNPSVISITCIITHLLHQHQKPFGHHYHLHHHQQHHHRQHYNSFET